MVPKKDKPLRRKGTVMDEPAQKPAHPAAHVESFIIDYNQPDLSPYEHPFHTIKIGCKEYAVPRGHLADYPKLQICGSSYGSSSTLSDVDDDIGHTIIHFLYTGKYETLITAPKGVYDIRKELGRSIQVYHFAKTYEIPGLETLAKMYLERFGESGSIFDTLHTTRAVFSKLPNSEAWLRDYIYTKLRSSLESNENAFQQNEFYQALGGD